MQLNALRTKSFRKTLWSSIHSWHIKNFLDFCHQTIAKIESRGVESDESGVQFGHTSQHKSMNLDFTKKLPRVIFSLWARLLRKQLMLHMQEPRNFIIKL